MTTTIVDRRDEPNRHKFGKDRSRFLNRIRESVKKAIHEKVASGSIRDFDQGGVRVPIPKKTTQQPVLQHKNAPYFKKVFPGNTYDVGDVIPIPLGGGGSGEGEASDGDDNEHDHVWVPEDQWLDIFFDGRSLPDMVKLHNEGNHVTQLERSGHTVKGPSHKMDVVATNTKRKADSLVLNRASERRLIQNLTEQYNIYQKYFTELPVLDLQGKSKPEKIQTISETLDAVKEQFDVEETQNDKLQPLKDLFNCVGALDQNIAKDVSADEDIARLDILKKRESEQLRAGQKASKFQDKHLTYHFDEEKPVPATKAVMICKMDVSGSMTQGCKNNAKAFFWILHKFLQANYEDVELVFITHTTTAEEVDEEEFFFGTRSGGTMVSSCLEKEMEIMTERYSGSEWNIYSAQASDGDNYGHDNEVVRDLMDKILPLQQASYFIETRDPNDMWRGNNISELHEMYMSIAEEHPNLKTAFVKTPGEALEAFTNFFPVGSSKPANQPKVA